MINKTQIILQGKYIYSTEVLKPNLCDYNNAYILVKSNTTIIGHNTTQVAFKNYVPFIKSQNAEDLDLVMPMCKLLEYS